MVKNRGQDKYIFKFEEWMWNKNAGICGVAALIAKSWSTT
tara:strand:- start:663 stop:782 length:120 start_codon:yes stop_codon:yes gene_type:complete